MEKFALALVLILAYSLNSFAEDIKLPEPQKAGGPALYNAIDHRASANQNTFPSGELSQQELSTILWAASGHNRNGKLWTVPMAMGRPPYCKIYITNRDGVYLYDWRNHTLVQISSDNVHSRIPTQPFAKNAPVNLYIVEDGEQMAQMNGPTDAEFPLVLAGAMSQNIYLASQGLWVGARMAYSINRDEAAKAFNLGPRDKALFVIVLGKNQ